MAWAINDRNLPRVHGYRDAVEVATDTTRRDFDNGWLGLHNRRDSSKLVRKFGDQVRFRYHHTDMVIWHTPDHLEAAIYSSQSSIIFANRFLPCGVSARSHKSEMYLGDSLGDYRPLRGDTLHFHKDEHGGWNVDRSNVMQYETCVLDRKLAARARKTLKPFEEWKKSVRRLGAGSEHGHTYSCVPRELKRMMHKGHIPEERYADLANYNFGLIEAYILSGAVTKVEQPIGWPKRETPYDHSPAWALV